MGCGVEEEMIKKNRKKKKKIIEKEKDDRGLNSDDFILISSFNFVWFYACLDLIFYFILRTNYNK